jgi:hypothetical protein
MTVPLATTTITLLAPIKDAATPSDADDWGTGADPETGFEVTETGVRAHLSSRSSSIAPTAFGQFTPAGNTEQLKFRLVCDPCSLQAAMRVKDETTGLTYDVAWVTPRPEPLRHLVASITRSYGTP